MHHKLPHDECSPAVHKLSGGLRMPQAGALAPSTTAAPCRPDVSAAHEKEPRGVPVMSSSEAPSGSPPPFDPVMEWEGIAPPTGTDSSQAGLVGCCRSSSP